MKDKTKLKIILLLSLLGIVVAVYQTYEHYAATGTICDFSATFSCSAVTESRFGEFPPRSGVATAFWGLLWWIGLIFLVWKLMKKPDWLKNLEFIHFLYVLSGVGFIIYLLVVELYILPLETGEVIICPFCTVQHVLILIILFIAYTLLKKPIKKYFKETFFTDKNKLHPGPLFILGTLLVIFAGMFVILKPEPIVDHYEFTACLAENGATMYGFDACPHCNKQKVTLGPDAFKQELDEEGYYVRCRPTEEANELLGDRVNRISSVEELTEEMTQNEACSVNVGAGTPTWVINGQKYIGEQSLEDLAEATGCELPV